MKIGERVIVDAAVTGDGIHRGLLVEDVAEEPVPGLYVEETVCPYPERECCEGCPKYVEDEGICDMEY